MNMKSNVRILLASLSLAACASPAPGAAVSPVVARPDPVVHVHAAGEAAFFANAYLVETEHGVVAVDAPFTVTEAKRFRAELDALKKPLLAVLVTHAHPDHVNGITALVEGRPEKAPIYALSGVQKTLREIDGPKRAYWTPIYKDEYPTRTTFPDTEVKDGETITLDGVGFTAHDVGAGESADETVWTMEKDAFVGDLVMNRVHPWLAEGRSGAWISSLAAARPLLAKATKVYPGHGVVGDASALEWQKSYLEAYRAAVAEVAKGKASLDDAQKKALETRMKAFLPGAPLEALIAMGADPVAAELSHP